MARKEFPITSPTEADAPRIAEIHLAAMDSNPLLHAQFPTPESLEGLQVFLAKHTADQLALTATDPDAEKAIVARDPDTRVIVSFAKWNVSSGKKKEKDDGVASKVEAGELQDTPGCRPEYLEGYATRAEDAKAQFFGDEACYQLSFVCTDPSYQGQGVGTLLTRKVVEMAAADGLPVYLESTILAVPMYEKLGFKAIGSFEMDIPPPLRRVTGDGGGLGESHGAASCVYREVCMVWHP